jgi:hypothetical protein
MIRAANAFLRGLGRPPLSLIDPLPVLRCCVVSAVGIAFQTAVLPVGVTCRYNDTEP